MAAQDEHGPHGAEDYSLPSNATEVRARNVSTPMHAAICVTYAHVCVLQVIGAEEEFIRGDTTQRGEDMVVAEEDSEKSGESGDEAEEGDGEDLMDMKENNIAAEASATSVADTASEAASGGVVAETSGSTSHGGGDDQQEPASINVGDRLHIPRDDQNQACTASVMAVKNGGPMVVIYDDMFWAAFRSDDVLELLRLGTVWKVADRDDVEADLRARVFLRPFNGAPPHYFLFGEDALREAATSFGWRWFSKLMPAPPNGTFAQKYSPPGMGGSFVAGARVKLCGRVAKLMPAKRCEPKEPLTTETPFVLLGFVQATLPNQKSYWAIVHSKSNANLGNTYATSIFGKGGESHMTRLPEDAISNIDDAKLHSLTMAAKVC